MYDGFIMILIPIIFGLALYDFLDSEHFPIAFQVFSISGISLIFLLSIIFIVWLYRFIYCNKHVKIEYIGL